MGQDYVPNLAILKSAIASAPLIGGETSSSMQDASAAREMLPIRYFDCELILWLILILVEGSAEAKERLLMPQAFPENECDQQPQEMMATNSNSA